MQGLLTAVSLKKHGQFSVIGESFRCFIIFDVSVVRLGRCVLGLGIQLFVDLGRQIDMVPSVVQNLDGLGIRFDDFNLNPRSKA